MNIVSVRYRFLRLNSEQLALVEIYPFNNKPEPTTCLYPEFPYLSPERVLLAKILKDSDWLTDWKYSFNLAVTEAKNYPEIDYRSSISDVREVILWNYLNPLDTEIHWDEYCPLFDNHYNYILRG